jgi:hypothetical protein
MVGTPFKRAFTRTGKNKHVLSIQHGEVPCFLGKGAHTAKAFACREGAAGH